MGLLSAAARRALRSGLMFSEEGAEAGLSKAQMRQMMYSRRYPTTSWVEDSQPTITGGYGGYRDVYEPGIGDKANAKAMLDELLELEEEWKRRSLAKRRYMLGQARSMREQDMRSGSDWLKTLYGMAVE